MNKSRTGYILLAWTALFAVSLSSAASAADVARLVEPCTACHGKDGNNSEADVPNIAGYSEDYLANTIKRYQRKEMPCVETAFRSGSNKGAKTDMCKSVKDLSESDIQQIGEYFAGKTFARTAQSFDAALAKKGKSVHINKCDTCHSESGTAASDDAGILGGQKTAYLKQQIKFFKDGKRPISKKMKPKLESLDDAQIEAIIHYYASIQ